MFRGSSKSSQLSLFTNLQVLLSGSSLKAYEDSQGWHHQFRREVIQRIDEGIFRSLFSDGHGAPNASIRVLIGMMVLKEAHGWSDSQLFEQCQFNILVRCALGLLNMDDALPAASTYYLLRKRIVCWEREGHENLIEKAFAALTKSQAIDFSVHGKKIRMDSKLMGSNIAWYSRYELIHESLSMVYRYLKGCAGLSLTDADISLLEEVSGESGEKVSYRSSKSEIESRLTSLGIVICKIIRQTGDNQHDTIRTLHRVFSEQYCLDEDVVTPRAKQTISAASVQSPHDTQCHYRNKDDNQVKGYSINVAETCDVAGYDADGKPENKLNLITHVSVDVASVADCDFLQPAVKATHEVVCAGIEAINADGAYHSPGNQDYCRGNNIDLILGAIQGKTSRYDLSLREDEELVVTDLQTGTVVSSRRVESRKKGAASRWAIRNDKGKHRYFSQRDIDTCTLRKQIAVRPQSELNVRNNVEATIFQLGYHYPNDKSRYRGLVKHKIWANVRCVWVNFVRIVNFVARNGSNHVKKVKKWFILASFWQNPIKTTYIIQFMVVLYPKYCKYSFKTGF